MNIEIDVLNEIRKILEKHNISCKANSYRDALVDFLTYNKKLVSLAKRKIYVSKEIENKINSFSKKNAFNAITADAQNGRDLNPYQSDTLRQMRFHDRLLYIWNIYHFHLSTENDFKNKYFKKRTNNLVFAYINIDSIYFLDFDKHSVGVFANENWLAIIQKNWPYLIEQFRDSVITDVWPNVTPSERQDIWDKGITLGMTNVNGIVYHDPGIGITTSGHSVLVMKQVSEVIRWVAEIYKWNNENADAVYSQLSLKYNIPIEKIELKARIKNTIELYEKASGEILCTFPNIPFDNLLL